MKAMAMQSVKATAKATKSVEAPAGSFTQKQVFQSGSRRNALIRMIEMTAMSPVTAHTWTYMIKTDNRSPQDFEKFRKVVVREDAGDREYFLMVGFMKSSNHVSE